ncbi:ArsR/SmtB family transcription factor [Cellulomonas pakistanensis]|uniref:Transcriptional regulator n=1 Tax=Cellulomonas pakistanensis TaxID=992287 RepID=A0A919P9M2_9CELL|nr:winged helix-turn-helix domain-containing protein [Cellulomonas pakistanensis]GIG34939.1 transcriptional regulator [Cellulomonas pakistanensis]
MGRDRDFTAVGRALAVPARSTICNLLMDGSRRPAGELARLAGVSASTASDHLGVLVAAGLLRCHVHGRHRFYALAGPEVGSALEALGLIAPPAPVSGLRGTRRAEHLAAARFCYDHLAGALGTALTDAWLAAGWLADPDALALTPRGAAGLRGLGVAVDAAVAGRRATTRACLDWTERRPHLGGAVGAAVGTRFLDAGWVVRHRSGRGLTVTPAGETLLRESFGIDLAGRAAADLVPGAAAGRV